MAMRRGRFFLPVGVTLRMGPTGGVGGGAPTGGVGLRWTPGVMFPTV
jgi:hypothetical protein